MSQISTAENPVEVYAECCGWCFTRHLSHGERTDELDPATENGQNDLFDGECEGMCGV